jgi:peptidoglycan/xylan/chitin deacetylase (PgdA/CDA1 family)
MKNINYKAVFLILFVIMIMCSGCGAQPKNDKDVYVVFRYDDYSSNSDTEIELKIINTFRSINAPITFGVIPYSFLGDTYDGSTNVGGPLPTKKTEFLKEGIAEGILEIGMHGFNHQNNNSNQSSEFSGLDYENQFEKLKKGKSYLESILGLPITIFIPPWQSYDLNTLRALEVLNFSTLSAYKNGGEAEKTSNLNFIPSTCFLSDLKTGVIAAREVSFNQPLLVVLLHDDDFVEVAGVKGSTTHKEFSDLMSWLVLQNDVKIISMSQAKEIIKDLSAQRYISVQNPSPLNIFISSTLDEETYAKFLYQEIEISPITWFRVIGFYLIIGGCGVLLSFILTFLVLANKKRVAKIITILSLLLSGSLLIFTFYDLHVYRRAMMINAGSIGISTGFLIYLFYYSTRKVKAKIT